MKHGIDEQLKAVESYALKGYVEEQKSIDELLGAGVDERTLVCGLARWMIETTDLDEGKVRRAEWLAKALDPATHEELGRSVNAVAIRNTVEYVDPYAHLKKKNQSPEAKYRRVKSS